MNHEAIRGDTQRWARSSISSTVLVLLISAPSAGCLVLSPPDGAGGRGGSGGALAESSSSSTGGGGLVGAGGAAGQGGAGGGGVGASGGAGGAGGTVNVCGATEKCVNAPPSGWEGYTQIQKLPYSTDPAPACPDGSKAQVYYAGPAMTADCVPCSCTFSGASCTAPKVDCFWDGNCAGASDFSHQGNNENCIVDVPGATSNTFCKISAEPNRASKGTCAAAGGQLANQPFAERVTVCPVTGGAVCGQGGQCVSVDPGKFDPGICVLRSGTDPCPAGFSLQSQLYGAGMDARMCTACTCDTDAITCSGGSYVAYEGDGCDGVTKTISGLGQCTNVGTYLDANTGALRPQLGTPSSGTCSGGVGSGVVQGDLPRKLCCMTL